MLLLLMLLLQIESRADLLKVLWTRWLCVMSWMAWCRVVGKATKVG